MNSILQPLNSPKNKVLCIMKRTAKILCALLLVGMLVFFCSCSCEKGKSEFSSSGAVQSSETGKSFDESGHSSEKIEESSQAQKGEANSSDKNIGADQKNQSGASKTNPSSAQPEESSDESKGKVISLPDVDI